MRANKLPLDDRDRAILRLLQADGRLTNLELAQRINLSPSACLRRVKLLEESGLIARYVRLLDETLAGLPGTAFVLVTLDQQGRAALDAFEAEIKRHPEVTECCLLAGTADYMVRVAYADAADFERILTEPNFSLTEQYKALLATEGLNITFPQETVKRLAEIAWQVNEKTENIGARRLHTLLERLLEEVSFSAGDLAGQQNGAPIVIDAAYVNSHLGELAQDEDLSRYIL